MDWTNRDTEEVAGVIRQEQSLGTVWQEMTRVIIEDEPEELRVSTLARQAALVFTTQPAPGVESPTYRKHRHLPEDRALLADLAGINFRAVNWRQIAEWLIAEHGKTDE